MTRTGNASHHPTHHRRRDVGPAAQQQREDEDQRRAREGEGDLRAARVGTRDQPESPGGGEPRSEVAPPAGKGPGLLESDHGTEKAAQQERPVGQRMMLTEQGQRPAGPEQSGPERGQESRAGNPEQRQERPRPRCARVHVAARCCLSARPLHRARPVSSSCTEARGLIVEQRAEPRRPLGSRSPRARSAEEVLS